MKKKLHTLRARYHKLAPFSKVSMKLGAWLMVCFYIVAIVARAISPVAANYFAAMAIYRGALEAAPACLAVGVCAGLLGDLMLQRGEKRR